MEFKILKNRIKCQTWEISEILNKTEIFKKAFLELEKKLKEGLN
jgi:hypothetical protein